MRMGLAQVPQYVEGTFEEPVEPLTAVLVSPC